MQAQLFTSNSEHWCTPKKYIQLIQNNFGEIHLDPCSNKYSSVNAKHELSLEKGQDGLQADWSSFGGLVFVNPPYGRKISKWTNKILHEAGKGVEIIALLPSRTDTKWFHDEVIPASTALVFVEGRISFINGSTGLKTNPATFPSVFVYYGPRVTKFYKAFSSEGLFLSP